MRSIHGALPLAGAVVLFAALGCRPGDRASGAGARASASSAPARPVSSARAPPKKLPPLAAESWRIDLPVEGFGATSVSVPLGATEPRPVLVVLHGHDDRPDWQCGSWRGIAASYPFVLCPRGLPMKHKPHIEERFTWGGPEQTAHELRAALAALKRRFGDYIAPSGVVLGGYSLGAERAHQVGRQEPKFFSRLVLVEGGFHGFTSGVATIFAKGGGERVLFVCAQTACRHAAEPDVVATDRAGAEARLVFAGNLGHVLDGRVVKSIAGEWAWVVAGLEGWKSWKK